MKIVKLKGFGEYVDQPFWDIHTMVFRGVDNSNFELIPSIGRPRYGSDDNLLSRFEKDIFEDFKIRAYPYLTHQPDNDFEWMFLAQHYGIPTRILDWTTNPLVALYFACEKNFENDGAVYKTILSKEYINLNETQDPFSISEIGLLRPNHKDKRYINQAGVFTIHPSPRNPMETSNMTKYILNVNLKEELHWLLRKMGISRTFIYPSLESLAHDVVQEHSPKLDNGTIRTSGTFLDW